MIASDSPRSTPNGPVYRVSVLAELSDGRGQALSNSSHVHLLSFLTPCFVCAYQEFSIYRLWMEKVSAGMGPILIILGIARNMSCVVSQGSLPAMW